MYYLKCNNCGHLNELKGEYLVFCSNCHKKLANNFSDWKSKNPDGTFNDFIQLMAISESDIQRATVKPKSKHLGLKIGIGCLVLFVLVAAGIGTSLYFLGTEFLERFMPGKTSEEVMTQEWVKETYGNSGLSIETPVKLTKGDLPYPDNIRQIMDQVEAYKYDTDKGFKIILTSVKYKPVVQYLDLQAGANGSVNEMKKQPGVTDFEYTEEATSRNNIPGIIQKGTYKHLGVKIEFVNTLFAKDMNFWQIMVAYQADDEVGRKAAQRVIDSIEINYHGESI